MAAVAAGSDGAEAPRSEVDTADGILSASLAAASSGGSRTQHAAETLLALHLAGAGAAAAPAVASG